MKKILLILILIIISAGASFGQIKQRANNTEFYLGFGYKFVFLTNPDARNSYPFFQLSSGDFLKEIDGYFGAKVNQKFGVEFSPAYLFTNAVNSDGFYFTDVTNGTRFYVPVQTRLFAVPLNIRFKYFPFPQNYSSVLGQFYFGGGGGAMYATEEITSQIYSDETRFNYLTSRSYKESFWTSNFEMMIGIGSFAKIGYGFELSYRFVPLKHLNDKPLVTATASNFNSINFSANVFFSF